MMDLLFKVLVTLAIIAMLLLFTAAFTQEFNRPLADMFGYTGLGLLGVDVFALAVFFLIMLWSDDD